MTCQRCRAIDLDGDNRLCAGCKRLNNREACRARYRCFYGLPADHEAHEDGLHHAWRNLRYIHFQLGGPRGHIRNVAALPGL